MVHVLRQQTKWLMAMTAAVGSLLTGCAPESESEEPRDIKQAAVASANGLRAINGLRAFNGLSENGFRTLNGSTSLNGLRTLNGLSPTQGLMTTADGRDTVSYLVRCALPAGVSITKSDQNGVSYTFTGQIGVAPQWADNACDEQCQQHVSACMLAHVNTTGQHISLWLDGDSPALGWGQSTDFPYQEGSFFGNIFKSPPEAYYCNGADFDSGVVPGRLGATQTGAPYVNPFASQGGACKTVCTPQDIPNQDDGFKACWGFNHVVTVWRNFDPKSAYKICNKTSGKCLDAASTATGAKIVQKAYTGATSQKWSIQQVAAGKYKVVNGASSKVLTVSSSSIVQNTAGSSTSQQWSFASMKDGTGQYRITPASSTGSALALPSSGSTSEGTALTSSTWKTTNLQKWTISIAE